MSKHFLFRIRWEERCQILGPQALNSEERTPSIARLGVCFDTCTNLGGVGSPVLQPTYHTDRAIPALDHKHIIVSVKVLPKWSTKHVSSTDS